MKPIRIGILGASDIALKRFLPALKKSYLFEYIGLASNSPSKAKNILNLFGGKIFKNYNDLILSNEIDAVYIPLPPALHYKWAKKALESEKHVFLEKPSTINLIETENLVNLAKENSLALKENYMFLFHNQIKDILELLEKNIIGKLHLIKIAFGFPKRSEEDFRYKKSLGGGALLDCGGYTIQLSNLLLGSSTRLISSSLVMDKNLDIDIFGVATLVNDNHLISQVSFGMDNYYKCELELWGSKGYIEAPRIFTPPPDFEPEILIYTNTNNKIVKSKSCDQFLSSIEDFYFCISNTEHRNKTYQSLLIQSNFIEKCLKGDYYGYL